MNGEDKKAAFPISENTRKTCTLSGFKNIRTIVLFNYLSQFSIAHNSVFTLQWVQPKSVYNGISPCNGITMVNGITVRNGISAHTVKSNPYVLMTNVFKFFSGLCKFHVITYSNKGNILCKKVL